MIGGLAVAALFWISANAVEAQTPGLAEQNDRLLTSLQHVHALSDSQMSVIRALFARARVMGQGNPKVTEHPVKEEDCEKKLAERGIHYENDEYAAICGGPYMAPLYDPETQRPADATVCIDQFEFPDIPCAYPVVWVRAKEAAEICEAMGKRLCDAHEWEGACAGRLGPPDYRFDLAEGQQPGEGVRRMRAAHNAAYASSKAWSYGPEYRKGVCGAASHKTPGCEGGQWDQCGSNTYPVGFFDDCDGFFEVYDLHGNAAEHMNLPLAEDQMASRGSRELGHTEMKGSWFIFDSYRAHDDWCRWRAPDWHGSRVMDPSSHRNYHLGFRCCKSLE